MADYVDSMSDAELMTKLTEYGFPMVPITGTSRKVMTKKLKYLLENRSKTNDDARRSLSKYSSEEESDTDVVKNKRDKGRRATVGVPSMQPPQTTRRRTTTKIVEPVVEKEIKTVRRSTRVVKVSQGDFDTGSDSEPEIVDEYPAVAKNNVSNHGAKDYDRKMNTSRSTYSTQSTVRSPGRSSVAHSSYSSSDVSPDVALDKLNQIRSRLSLSGNLPSTSSFSRKTTAYDGGTNPETPFLSNFTRRLSELSGPNSPRNNDGGSGYDAAKSDIIKEHDTNGSSLPYGRSYLSRAVHNRDISREFQTSQEKNIFKNNLVSFTLIGITIIFFIVIFVMYVGIRSDHPQIDASGQIIPYCAEMRNGQQDESKRGTNCLTMEDATGALNLLTVLKPELQKRAVTNICHDKTFKAYMTDTDIVMFVTENYALKDPIVVQQHLNSLQLLLFYNPDWGISVVATESGRMVGDVENMERLVKIRQTNLTGLIMFSPSLPLKCRFVNVLYNVAYAGLVAAVVVLLCFLSQRAYKYVKRREKEKNDRVFLLVEKIIDQLQSNSTDNNDNYLAVNHVRDMLIAPSDRKALSDVWDCAVKYLEENESRIRLENQIISGEECNVWRWVGSSNLNVSGSPKSRKWQGQAFETQVGSVNSPPCSPTPCLKIRGMVDDRDRNYNAIREAVLSKCAHQCCILHCAVDTTSGCVYLKCADQNEAAVAYRNLHGWWYSGHLVTVKYLRLERYMQRFPDSPSGPPYIKSATPATDWS